MMAPAADMFELGRARCRCCKRGTHVRRRAPRKLYDAYRAHAVARGDPAPSCARGSRSEVLRATVRRGLGARRARFWRQRDPAQVARAERDPKHRMALVFRWYLGKSSRWAIDGDAGAPHRLPDLVRPGDGRLQRWVAGSFLAEPGATAPSSQIALQPARGRGRRHPRRTSSRTLRRRRCPADARSSSARARSPERSSQHRVTRAAHRMTSQQTPIAVVGVSALFPGSHDARGFWRDILAGTRPRSPTCRRRTGSIEDYYDPDPTAPDKTYCKRGAFLSPVDFDPLEFGIPPSIVPATDTAQLLALIVAQQVLEDASQGQFATMDRERISVHPRRHLGAGAARHDGEPAAAAGVAQGAARERHPRGRGAARSATASPTSYVPWQERTFPGLLGNVVAGRIANRFDLGGTNCVVDAACASSLAALSMARQRAAARAVRPRDHRRRRHAERHLHVHVLQQDAGAVADGRLPAVLRQRRRHDARRGPRRWSC